VRCDPPLNEFEELSSSCEKLVGFGLCGYECMVVINEISLVPARFEEIESATGSGTQRKPRCLERQAVMTWRTGEPVSGTRK
jgi:hypothetical protein